MVHIAIGSIHDESARELEAAINLFRGLVISSTSTRCFNKGVVDGMALLLEVVGMVEKWC